MKVFYASMSSPVGKLWIASTEKGVCHIALSGRKAFFSTLRRLFPEAEPEENSRANRGAIAQLQEYFAGTRREFDLPLDLRGTPFQLAVWRELQRIPYGTTVSYGELARRIGRPGAARAVGMANHYNPVPILIPCHRVIGSDGNLVGFGGGLDMKRLLLDLESNGRAAKS